MTGYIHQRDIELLRRVLPNCYRDIEPFAEGGTRNCYIASWGPEGRVKRIIKIDKRDPESPRARRHVDRGCDTSNDAKALATIENPERHHLSRLVDYVVVDGVTISVEPYFESKSLETRIKEDGPLKVDEADVFVPQLVAGARHLVSKAEMFHRDLKPSNILVSEVDGIEVRITDFANARKKDEIEPGYQPTVGGHLVTDPRLLGEFNGGESVYDERAEVYALGMDIFHALTGEFPFEYDPDEGKAVVYGDDESLLGEDGRIDVEKHNKVLARALGKIPYESRKYRKIVKKCLTLDPWKRYESLEELACDVETATTKDFLNSWAFNRTIGGVGVVAIGALGVACLGAVGVAAHNLATGGNLLEDFRQASLEEKVQEEVEEEKPVYEVVARGNGGNLEITNNLVDMRMRVSVEDEGKWPELYPMKKKDRIKQGDKLNVFVGLKFAASPMSGGLTTTFGGKVYIEGFSGEEFWIYPSSHDDTAIYHGQGMIGATYSYLFVPGELPDGVYNLVAEIYAPKEKDLHLMAHSFKFRDPGRALCRRRVPLIVGNPKDAVNLYSVGLHPMETGRISIRPASVDPLDISTMITNMNPDLTYEVAVPEEEFSKVLKTRYRTTNAFSSGLPSPVLRHEGSRTLQVVYRDGEDIIGYSFVPIRGKPSPLRPKVFDPVLELPGRDFSDRIVPYRGLLYAGTEDDSK